MTHMAERKQMHNFFLGKPEGKWQPWRSRRVWNYSIKYSKYTCNATLRRFRATIVAVENL